MKKIILFSLLLLLVVFPKTIALAEDNGSKSAMVAPTPVVAMNNYALPYPGILPNNPLYMLKTLRDSIVVFFISDPVKKSEFYLLQSDKRLAASWALINEGQAEDALALSTLSKSTNYFDLAIAQVRLANSSGEDTGNIQSMLTDSLNKHMSIVSTMIPLVGAADKKIVTQELARLTSLTKVVSGLSVK